MIGIVLSSLVIYWAKSKVRRVILINTIMTLIATPFLLVFLLGCPTANLAGVQVPYAGEDSKYVRHIQSCSSYS